MRARDLCFGREPDAPNNLELLFGMSLVTRLEETFGQGFWFPKQAGSRLQLVFQSNLPKDSKGESSSANWGSGKDQPTGIVQFKWVQCGEKLTNLRKFHQGQTESKQEFSINSKVSRYSATRLRRALFRLLFVLITS